MKTTYIIEPSDLSKIKINLLDEKKFIDYYLKRTKMIRWIPSTDTFLEFNGLIDVSFTNEIILDSIDAKKIINRKNVLYLIKRILIGEFYFSEINKYAEIYRVVGEDVQNQKQMINEIHIVFDERIQTTNIPFKFKNFFYGTIFDYLEQKNHMDNII